MTVATVIEEKLQAALNPAELKVENVSHHHAGHGGSPNTGESHFDVLIVSKAFEGLSRLSRHRLVNEALATELAGPIHALSMITKAPSEVNEPS